MTHVGQWLLYGAYGYTGALVAREAVRRGHAPVLAGRSREKLEPLGNALGLPVVAFALDDTLAMERALSGIELVFHAAGPFVRTGAPMLDACLRAGVSYVDITGEIPMFQTSLARDHEAKERGVCVMSGVGFDVIPTDCLARYVADALPGATELEIAIATRGSPSAGTLKSVFESAPQGGLVRREGKLVHFPFGKGSRTIRFARGSKTAAPIPWGDLETAYATTAIPNITVYLAQPRATSYTLRAIGPVFRKAMSVPPLLRVAQAWIGRNVDGPDEDARTRGSSSIWARVTDARGSSKEAWLETCEGYLFTARGGVRAVERILAEKPRGALTPARAFGADFVLDIEGSTRYDAVPP